MTFSHQISKKPCWDAPREGLQHENIENEREFVEMLAQQEASKKKAAIQRKINEKRVDDMQETQSKLREKFIRVNEFMKECTDKSNRSEMQIEAAQKQQESYRVKIVEIERDLDELSKFEEKFKLIIDEFKPYEDVFNEVIESSEFDSFEELMSQSDALSKNLKLSKLHKQFLTCQFAASFSARSCRNCGT